MDSPLFAYENGDLQVYKDLEALVKATEPLDVDQREYTFWDANGLEFDLDTSVWPGFFQKVTKEIVINPDSYIGADQIRHVLSEYCQRNEIMEIGSIPEMTKAIALRMMI